MNLNINKYIDHTLLSPDATSNNIVDLCKEASNFNFASVCVPPVYVGLASKLLRDTDVSVSSVVGFPFGYQDMNTKTFEAKHLMEQGADELDVVVNLAVLKSGNWDLLRDEIDRISTAIQLKDKIMKLIFETGRLTQEEIYKLCMMCLEFRIDFAKTSTGFNGPGANAEVIAFMKSNLQGKVKIKASGGIRSYSEAISMIQAGADRIGTSSALAIVKEA